MMRKSWGDWFAKRVEQSRTPRYVGGGLYMTDEGPIPLAEAIDRFGYERVMAGNA